jgi:DNA-binding Lrp family transcriptional regulator
MAPMKTFRRADIARMLGWSSPRLAYHIEKMEACGELSRYVRQYDLPTVRRILRFVSKWNQQRSGDVEKCFQRYDWLMEDISIHDPGVTVDVTDQYLTVEC